MPRSRVPPRLPSASRRKSTSRPGIPTLVLLLLLHRHPSLIGFYRFCSRRICLTITASLAAISSNLGLLAYGNPSRVRLSLVYPTAPTLINLKNGSTHALRNLVSRTLTSPCSSLKVSWRGKKTTSMVFLPKSPG